MTNNLAFEKMKQMMELRGFAASTQKTYMMHLRQFTNHFSISFSDMDYDHVRDFLHHAISIRKLSCEYVNFCYSAIRFLYEAVFERDWNMKYIPRIKKKRKFPEVLSKDEILKIINSLDNLKHKAMLVTAYSAGLRVSDVANLKIIDVDSNNMQLFIRQSKGNKDRYALLSKTNLDILRRYYKEFKPKEWLFPGQNPSLPISTRIIQHVFTDAKNCAGIHKKVSPHTLRHYVESNIMGSEYRFTAFHAIFFTDSLPIINLLGL